MHFYKQTEFPSCHLYPLNWMGSAPPWIREFKQWSASTFTNLRLRACLQKGFHPTLIRLAWGSFLFIYNTYIEFRGIWGRERSSVGITMRDQGKRSNCYHRYFQAGTISFSFNNPPVFPTSFRCILSDISKGWALKEIMIICIWLPAHRMPG